MASRIRVPIVGGLNKSVVIDSGATVGSTIGVDLKGPTGQVLSVAGLASLLGVTSTPPGPTGSVIWQRVLQIPANITALAALTGQGAVTRRADGSFILQNFPVFQGADGEAGSDGDAGPPGPMGPQGPTGATGGAGPPGAGIPGSDGIDGVDADPVPGPQGPTGATGSTGSPGVTGAQGPPGPTGEDGTAGMDADPVPGPQGPTGATGAAGAAGAPGAQGMQGVPGWGVPGQDGEPGHDADPVPGPAGPTGAAGSQGPQGNTGATGATGPQGIPGPPGDDGYIGADGDSGILMISSDGGSTGANPTAHVGLSAVNGSATTFLRSDGAPPLDVTISPTWTGTHEWTNSASPVASIVGTNASGAFGLAIESSGGAGVFAGLSICSDGNTFDSTDFQLYQEGATAVIYNGANGAMDFYTDGKLIFQLGGPTGSGSMFLGVSPYAQSASFPMYALPGGGLMTDTSANAYTMGGVYYNGSNYINIGTSGGGVWVVGGTEARLYTSPSGTAGASTAVTQVLAITGGATSSFAILGWGPTAAALVDMTPDTGTFTATLTGCHTSPTATMTFCKISNLVTLCLQGALTASSSSTSMTFTGLPSEISGTRAHILPVGYNTQANASVATTNTASVQIGGGTTVTLVQGGSTTGFTSTGNKGLLQGWSVTYQLR